MKPSAQIVLLSVLSCLLVAPDTLGQRFRIDQPSFFEEGNEQFERHIEQLQQTQPDPILTVDVGIQQWQPIASQAGKFSVWAPLGILADDTETIQVGANALDFRILSSQTSAGKFVVAYADAPDVKTDQLFAAVKDALVERTTFDIGAVENVAIDDGSGESLTLIGDTEQISAYVLLGNDRIYVVGVRQARENASSDAANKFLTSFHLSSD